jgi:tripartite-type tricarboxylate transporter receptor subunit TctC
MNWSRSKPRPRLRAELSSLSLAACVAFAALPASSVSGSDYPARPIVMVVPFAAGGGTDGVARVVAEELGKAINGRVVIENKAGANGAIAATHVARSTPDGYTIFMTTNTTHSVNPGLMLGLKYDPLRDFQPIAQMGNHPFMLIVGNAVPAKTLPELIAYANSRPGKLSYGYGNGTGLVAAETLKRMAGIDVLKVPYRSTNDAIGDVMGGRIDMMFIDVTAGIGHVQAGSVRALAIANKDGTPTLPAVPPVAATLPDFDLLAWNGVFAPAGTPREVVDRLNAELRKILNRDGQKARFEAIGLDVKTGSVDELSELVRSELEKWTALIKAAGIEPQ